MVRHSSSYVRSKGQDIEVDKIVGATNKSMAQPLYPSGDYSDSHRNKNEQNLRFELSWRPKSIYLPLSNI